MIAVIAAIAEKKKVQRSYGNHYPAIAGTTIAEIELLYLTAIVVAAIAGELSHMIAMIAAIPEVIIIFFSTVAAITTAMVAIIWKPGFNMIMAYFKRNDCLRRDLYLNCVLLRKKP